MASRWSSSCAETDQKRLQFLGHRLLGSIGRGNEFVQTAELEKPTQVAQPAIAGLAEHHMGGREQPVEKVQALGGFQKPCYRLGTGTVRQQRSLPPDPVVQRPRRHVQLACDLSARGPGRVQRIELGDFLRHPPAGLGGRFRRATPCGTIQHGTHGLGLLQWVLLTTIESPNLGANQEASSASSWQGYDQGQRAGLQPDGARRFAAARGDASFRGGRRRLRKSAPLVNDPSVIIP